MLALTDRIAFDGRSLRRQGPVASLLHLLFGYRKQLSIDDFETVETQAVRTLRRGGRVRYRYRTQITGKGKEFVIVSGGHYHRHFVRELFPLIHESKLDNRSRDLRDYLNDPSFLESQDGAVATRLVRYSRRHKIRFRLGGKPIRRSVTSETPATPKTSKERDCCAVWETSCVCQDVCEKQAKRFVGHSTCGRMARG